ncbi:GNAT family N-acetyltransferase [Virgibacillus senegalensis]|uniref:GNAT family N-acetyltransferase n=1 Tax=Virgibacillus senegalensis TaxID=1499679 RepID=UPI00069EC736|nr:GNAT family N-acetyltransferase [Virgibacillus senegalensis]
MGIRFYQPADQAGIQQLFTRVFGKQRADSYWEWKYLHHPNPVNPWILVYEKNNRIAGHIALWVSEAYIEGKIQLVGLRVDTMVDPQDRGEGIYQQLNQAMFIEATKSGIKLLYGFPAPKARDLLLKHTPAREAGWMSRYVYIQNPFALAAGMTKFNLPVKRLGSLYKKITNRSKRSPASGLRLETVTACDQQFTDLADRLSATWPLMLRRNLSYLNWRYHQHPENDYVMIAAYNENTLVGYVVVKKERKRLKYASMEVGLIVDWLAIEDRTVWQVLLQAARDHLRHCDLLQSWALPETVAASILASAGFKKKDRPLALVVHSLQSGTVGSSLDDWYLVMGDVDSF